MDYEKAYNRVSHTWLKRCMELSRFSLNLINFLSRLHKGTTARVLANNSLFAEFPLYSGVWQGDSLAPLLFNIILQSLINTLTSQGVLCHVHVNDTTAVIHTQTECNTLLKLVATYEGESGALFNQGKTTIMSHPKAIHLQSPFCHTAKERYLGVTLHRGGRLLVLPASLDRIFNTLSTAHKLRILHLSRMNIINRYARPVLLFLLTAAKDHWAFNQMVEWEKWFLSLGNAPFNSTTPYRNQVKLKRLHSLNWGNLPPLHLQFYDRKQTQARKHPTWSPLK